MSLDLQKIKRVYFIGIKGVAMSGLALICKDRGLEVAGSDVSEKFITDKLLLERDILVFEEFNPGNIAEYKPDLVVVGASWGDANPEVSAVKAQGLPMITDSELRGYLSQEKKTIAVAGVHGKTTTTALLAHIFSQAQKDPSYLIGTGAVAGLGKNAAWGSGQHFIVEGDEYVRSKDEQPLRSKFLDLRPEISIITSIEWEHVDVFLTPESIEAAFHQLVEQTNGKVIGCGDWSAIQVLAKEFEKVVTYGFEPENKWRPTLVEFHYDKTTFTVEHRGESIGTFTIKLFGRHNVLNATAAIVASLEAGLNLDQITKGLETFAGTERRFDVSEVGGLVFIDDYGHHPSEIKTTLEAVRHRYPQKSILCVFQPHMASRTAAFIDDFAQSFQAVDCVIISDIFASAREQSHTITSKELVAKIAAKHPAAQYGGTLPETLDYVKTKIKPGMVIVTMGAGDVYWIRDQLVLHLE